MQHDHSAPHPTFSPRRYMANGRLERCCLVCTLGKLTHLLQCATCGFTGSLNRPNWQRVGKMSCTIVDGYQQKHVAGQSRPRNRWEQCYLHLGMNGATPMIITFFGYLHFGKITTNILAYRSVAFFRGLRLMN